MEIAVKNQKPSYKKIARTVFMNNDPVFVSLLVGMAGAIILIPEMIRAAIS